MGWKTSECSHGGVFTLQVPSSPQLISTPLGIFVRYSVRMREENYTPRLQSLHFDSYLFAVINLQAANMVKIYIQMQKANMWWHFDEQPQLALSTHQMHINVSAPYSRTKDSSVTINTSYREGTNNKEYKDN